MSTLTRTDPLGTGPPDSVTSSMPGSRRGWRRCLPFLGVALLALVPLACGDDATDLGPQPAAMEALTQPDLVAAGSPVELSVLVTDDMGQPLGDIVTDWEILSGGGSLSHSQVSTNADGIAEVTWTVGTAIGQGQVRARVEGLPAVTFSVTIEPGAVASVSVSPESLLLQALEATATLLAAASDEYGNEFEVDFDWSSLDEAVVTVSSAGVVTAQGEGYTVVVASAQGHADSVKVEVKQVPDAITVDPGSIHFSRLGATEELAAVAFDANGHAIQREPGEWVWMSSDPEVASVDEVGVVTSEGVGEAIITASLGIMDAMVDVTVTVTPITQVTASFSHTCAIQADDGQAFCWGRNTGGKLGDGTEEQRLEPGAVVGGQVFAAVSGGGRHTCGVTPGNEAYCWGTGAQGQLGDGAGEDSSTPVPVAGGRRFASISAGNFHTCAVTPEGEAYCWGHNTSGQVGGGETGGGRPEPVAVVGGHRFQSVVAGGNHTCGVTHGGEAYCWGAGTNGQLGDGEGSHSDTPVLVVGGHTFANVSTNQHFSCGATTDGRAYCWGRGSAGELGTGATQNEFTPAEVASEEVFATVDLGPDRACGITTAGAAYCWGGSFLGDGSEDSSAVPVAVSGGHVFRQISRGTHACGITTDDELWCWGSGSRGRLGTGTLDHHLVPVHISVRP